MRLIFEALHFRETIMHTYHTLTKQQESKTMFNLMARYIRRRIQAPQSHYLTPPPCVEMRSDVIYDDEIKRQLCVGMGTMDDRLREYKDPFELAPAQRSIDIGLADISGGHLLHL
jgi:hypothetical protein